MYEQLKNITMVGVMFEDIIIYITINHSKVYASN